MHAWMTFNNHKLCCVVSATLHSCIQQQGVTAGREMKGREGFAQLV
jgi:hypothetical protein